jgi:hypothetical protein
MSSQQPPNPAPRSATSRWLRRLVYLLAAIAALWVLAWGLVPPLLKSQAEKAASQQLGRQLTFGSVEFKPWTMELELRDLVLASQSGAQEQLRVGRVYVDAELQSLLRLAPVIDGLQIEGLRGNITHAGGGKYDFDDILEKFAAKPQAEAASNEPFQFAVYNIDLKDWALSLDDRPTNKKHEIRDFALSLPFLSNLEAQRQVKIQPRLAFQLNGSKFDSTGEATPFVQTHKSDAKISIRQLDLKPYLPYLPAGMPIKPIAAMLGADLTLAFEQNPKAVVRISGQVRADNISLLDIKSEPLLEMQSLKVSAQDVRPLERIVKLDLVELNAPALHLKRSGAGGLNLFPKTSNATKSIAPRAQPISSKAQNDLKNPARPWQVSVARVALTSGSLTWADETTSPRALLKAQALAIEAKSIAWPFAPDKPIAFEGSSQVEQGSLTFSGTATDANASVTAQLSGLPLGALAPYVNGVLSHSLTGLTDVQAGILWQAPRAEQNAALKITFPKAQLANLQLAQGKNRLAQVKLLSADSALIDLNAQTVNVSKVAATGVQTRIERSEQGRWMAQDWIKESKAPNASASASKAPASKRWKVSVGEISLDAPQLVLVDRAPAEGSGKVVELDIRQLKAKVSGFAIDGGEIASKPMPISLSGSVAQSSDGVAKSAQDAGKIDLKGQLALAPLALQLESKITRLPIHALAPYFDTALNIDLLRLDASYTGQLQMAQTAQGLQLKLAGDAVAEELQTTLRGAALAASSGAVEGDELINWKALSVRGLAIDMSPGAALKIDVGEAAATDFFARILLSEQGRINLADIVKSNAPSAATATTATASTTASNTINSIAPRADPVRPNGQNDLKIDTAASPAPIINIDAISLINGKMYFSDRFIKPNYAANLSELTGKLGAFSSQPVGGTVQMADLELRGKVEGTASLEVLGKLNPLAKPLALDITGKVRDLELAPLTPYSVKFAGHGIERGKLSVDVKYLVKPDGQLTAANKITLNQLKFGDKVDGAPNSLPVKLAVALLADRNGVIDIDLPVSGSLNDPQFSVGTIVFKLIINLVVKAITSPFTLLASAFGGGGDELGQVSFAAGSAALSTQANPGLEKIVKAMQDRPNLKMTVVGQASLDAEREGYKKERLKALVAAEKRRTAVASGSTGTATASVTAALTVSDAEYPALLKEVYKRSDVPKPRNAVGFVKDIPAADMEALLLANLPVSEQAMQELALARGVAVRDHLAAQGLPTDRLFLGAAKAVGKDEIWSPRAELSLAAP